MRQLDYTQFLKILRDGAVTQLQKLVGKITILNNTDFEDFACNTAKRRDTMRSL